MFLGNLESAAQSTPHSSYLQKHPLLELVEEWEESTLGKASKKKVIFITV